MVVEQNIILYDVVVDVLYENISGLLTDQKLKHFVNFYEILIFVEKPMYMDVILLNNVFSNI